MIGGGGGRVSAPLYKDRVDLESMSVSYLPRDRPLTKLMPMVLNGRGGGGGGGANIDTSAYH